MKDKDKILKKLEENDIQRDQFKWLLTTHEIKWRPKDSEQHVLSAERKQPRTLNAAKIRNEGEIKAFFKINNN